MKPKKKKETTYTDKGTKREQVDYKYSKGNDSTTYRPYNEKRTKKTTEKRTNVLGDTRYKKKSKVISTKRAERQMDRKDKRY